MTTTFTVSGPEIYRAIKNALAFGNDLYIRVLPRYLQVTGDNGGVVVGTKVMTINDQEEGEETTSGGVVAIIAPYGKDLLNYTKNQKGFVSFEVNRDDITVYAEGDSVSGIRCVEYSWSNVFNPSLKGGDSVLSVKKNDTAIVSAKTLTYLIDNAVSIARQGILDHVELSFNIGSIMLRSTDFVTYFQATAQTINEWTGVSPEDYKVPNVALNKMSKLIGKRGNVAIHRAGFPGEGTRTEFYFDDSFVAIYDSENEFIPEMIDIDIPEDETGIEFSPVLNEKALKYLESIDDRGMKSLLVGIEDSGHLKVMIHDKMGNVQDAVFLSKDNTPRDEVYVSVYEMGAIVGKLGGVSAMMYLHSMDAPILIKRTTEEFDVSYILKTFKRNVM